MEIYARNKLIWGQELQSMLFQKHIAVFGLGGVGSYAVDALARSGIGNFSLIDFDDIAESNINRQLLALSSTVGLKKTDLMEQRIKDINSSIRIIKYNDFCTNELAEQILTCQVDYVVDAIDTQKSKVELLELCYTKKIPVITSLGAGNRLNPEELYTADISKINSKKCSFAKSILYKLRKKGIESGITAVLSKEPPCVVDKILSQIEVSNSQGEKLIFNKYSPGSTPFVPPVAGYIMASYIIRDFIQQSRIK